MPNNLLLHGRLFVTPHYVLFGSWGATRLTLAIEDISFIEKANTMVSRSALLITIHFRQLDLELHTKTLHSIAAKDKLHPLIKVTVTAGLRPERHVDRDANRSSPPSMHTFVCST
jgi:hypothetical protein